MASAFLWIKALHVVSIISWMASLLYLFRLYVYHAMAEEKVVQEQLQVMELRLLRYIGNPALIMTLVSGYGMLFINPGYLGQHWMHLKLTAVFALFGMHGLAAVARKKLIADPKWKSDKWFRVMNEVPTLLMIIIVVAVIVKPF